METITEARLVSISLDREPNAWGETITVSTAPAADTEAHDGRL